MDNKQCPLFAIFHILVILCPLFGFWIISSSVFNLERSTVRRKTDLHFDLIYSIVNSYRLLPCVCMCVYESLCVCVARVFLMRRVDALFCGEIKNVYMSKIECFWATTLSGIYIYKIYIRFYGDEYSVHSDAMNLDIKFSDSIMAPITFVEHMKLSFHFLLGYLQIKM